MLETCLPRRIFELTCWEGKNCHHLGDRKKKNAGSHLEFGLGLLEVGLESRRRSEWNADDISRLRQTLVYIQQFLVDETSG